VTVERVAAGTDLLDLLDQVLDKGITIQSETDRPLTGSPDLEERVVAAVSDLFLAHSYAPGQGGPMSFKVGNARSAASDLRPEDDDDDEDGGDGGQGSSGAPATVERPIEPRRRPPSRPHRTGRTRR
jgi:hypothetical protein